MKDAHVTKEKKSPDVSTITKHEDAALTLSWKTVHGNTSNFRVQTAESKT